MKGRKGFFVREKELSDGGFGNQFATVAFHAGFLLFKCKVMADIFVLITVKNVAVRFTIFEVAISDEGRV